MAVVKVLSGHTSEDSAYLVDDYPYGRTVRTKIRYWLERDPKKGYRFVSQTLNPKTNRWNNPKKSTYNEFAAAMYLDENGHVKWDALGAYSEAPKFREFLQNFPGVETVLLHALTLRKIAFLKRAINQNEEGKTVFTINEKHGDAVSELERHKVELTEWEDILATFFKKENNERNS